MEIYPIRKPTTVSASPEVRIDTVTEDTVCTMASFFGRTAAAEFGISVGKQNRVIHRRAQLNGRDDQIRNVKHG